MSAGIGLRFWIVRLKHETAPQFYIAVITGEGTMGGAWVVYDAVVRPAMMYEAEPLAMKKAQENTLDVVGNEDVGFDVWRQKVGQNKELSGNESGRNSQESVRKDVHC